jgi:hypothetical protein
VSFPALLAPGNGSELIEHLHADLAAAQKQRARLVGLRAGLLGIALRFQGFDLDGAVTRGDHIEFAAFLEPELFDQGFRQADGEAVAPSRDVHEVAP